ncbi:MAG: sensor hybrid histidine kinase [Chthonomonadaceae bacterium]|nr:sensor hybrid histidine kinase [Chthonomonadaceae bacterium]
MLLFAQPADSTPDGFPARETPPVWSGYLVAVVSVGFLTLVRLSLDPWLGPHHPFVVFLLAAMISSWYAGLGPGLLATFLGTGVSWYLFGDPRYTVALDSPDDYLGIGISVIAGVAVSSLNETRIRAQRSTLIHLQHMTTANERLRQETAERIRQEEALKESQQQLFQAQKMESIGRLAGGIAHDFNNLLTAILGYAELAQMSLAPDAEEQSYIRNIEQAGNRAAELTAQLLTYARGQVMSLEIINLNAVLNEVRPLLERLLSEDIELAIRPAEDLWNVRADASKLQQIVLNLAINARDAMQHGGRLLIEVSNVTLGEEVAAHNAEVMPGEYVVLNVSDTGIGMAEEVREHIFEPFFTTKEMGKGTGLGLATCYGLIKQFHGHIEVHSEPGQGASFQVYIPRVHELMEVMEATMPEDTTPEGSETILLVEDESMVRDIATQSLRSLGYHVLVAANGADALKIHSEYEEPIALLVTDVVMPWMNGKELAERILEKRPNIRVLFISGYTNNVILHKGVLDDGVTLLQKPFTSSALGQKVRQILDSIE